MSLNNTKNIDANPFIFDIQNKNIDFPQKKMLTTLTHYNWKKDHFWNLTIFFVPHKYLVTLEGLVIYDSFCGNKVYNPYVGYNVAQGNNVHWDKRH